MYLSMQVHKWVGMCVGMYVNMSVSLQLGMYVCKYDTRPNQANVLIQQHRISNDASVK